jgi:hypothetical protein
VEINFYSGSYKEFGYCKSKDGNGHVSISMEWVFNENENRKFGKFFQI